MNTGKPTTMKEKLKAYFALLKSKAEVIIAAAGLLVAYLAYRQTISSKTEEELVVWDIKMNYEPNNVGLLSFEIKPQGERVKLQSFEMFFPSDFTSTASVRSEGNKLPGFKINSALYNMYEKYYYLPVTENNPFYYYTGQKNCYPVCIKYIYEQNEKVTEAYYVYKIEFEVYGEQKLKIKELKYVMKPKSFDAGNRTLIDNINCNECLQEINCNNDYLFDLIMQKKPLLTPAIYLATEAGDWGPYYMDYTDDKGKVVDTDSIMAPYFITDKDEKEKYLRKLFLINRDTAELIQPIKECLRDINEFLKIHPIPSDISYDSLAVSEWSNQYIIDDWTSLCTKLKMSLLQEARKIEE